MSNLLELAEKARIQRELEKQGKRALETLQAKRNIENYINEQKQILQDQLKKERQSFQGNLQKEKQAHQEELKSLQERIESSRKDLVKKYEIPFWGLLGCILVMGIGLAYLTWEMKSQYEKMLNWKQSAEQYKAASKEMVIANCKMPDKTHRLCVKIDPNYQDQEWGDNMKIIARKEE